MRYTIKKGNRYHSNWLQRLLFFRFGNRIKKTITFDKNCWYEKSDVEYTGVNKLIGFSGWDHHKNSARFGWQPIFHKEGWINIYAYWYSNGKRGSEIIGTAKVNGCYNIELKCNKNNVIWAFDDNIEWVQTMKTKTWKRLQFYFGGKSKAPKTIKCSIK